MVYKYTVYNIQIYIYTETAYFGVASPVPSIKFYVCIQFVYSYVQVYIRILAAQFLSAGFYLRNAWVTGTSVPWRIASSTPYEQRWTQCARLPKLDSMYVRK